MTGRPPAATVLRRTPADAEFFDAAARGELMIRGCAACARALPTDAYTCPDPAHPAGLDGLDWLPASGRASLVSWIVVHRVPHSVPAADVPYLTALVELDEGPWLEARLLDADSAALRVGDRLRAVFVHPADPADGESFPVFVPDPGHVPDPSSASPPGDVPDPGPAVPNHPTTLATGDPSP